MASTINEVRRERHQALRTLKRYARGVDTGVEALQRLLERVLSRKLKIPESKDLVELEAIATAIDRRVMELLKAIADAAVIFSTL
jgi:hypothetical protein